MAYPSAVKEDENGRSVSEEIKKSGIYTAKTAKFVETEPSVNAEQKSRNCSVM